MLYLRQKASADPLSQYASSGLHIPLILMA